MQVKVYWIDAGSPGRLGMMPRPRGGDWLEDEVASLRHSGADIVVSLLGGLPVDEAFTKVENARGCQVPDTPEQRAWVARFAVKSS